MAEPPRTIDQIAAEAAEIDSLDARLAYLHVACAGDTGMREAVEMRVEHLLAERATRSDVGLGPMDLGYGKDDRVGRYRLIERLGEGGFGVVWRAEQTEPVRREVAVKLIKPGMDSGAVLARFEAERQALAVMDHPCIAKIFDGGATERGLPYFAMERVKGLSITEHCDRHRLSLDERIDLFIRVCDAVQHAHMKGVVHRDLKPSNILVEYEESKSTPKVIDFGVAKALNTRLADKTIFTQQGQMIGTPEYMSPEQAEMSEQDIDTRSDIYSLGVILYELLTGARPFDAASLRLAAFAEIQRIIREVEPPRPSTKLSSLASSVEDPAAGNRVAEARRTELQSLTATLRRDLDWVVMKCLEKDRSRRYDTANALAEELARFLRNEPVLAGPPSAKYRVGKFISRNRTSVTVGSIVAVALLVATGVSIAFALIAVRQRSLAETLLTQRDEALKAEKDRADELQQIAAFQSSQLGGLDAAVMGQTIRAELRSRLKGLAKRRNLDEAQAEAMLAEFDANLVQSDIAGLARHLLAKDLFEPAVRAINQDFGGQPLVRARLLQAVATNARDLSLLELAEDPQRQALELRRRGLGESHPETLESVVQASRLRFLQGDVSEAERLATAALSDCRTALGVENPITLDAMNLIAFILESKGSFNAAESLYREERSAWIRLQGEGGAGTLRASFSLGQLCFQRGDLDGAEQYFLEALDGTRRKFGDDHVNTIGVKSRLGELLLTQGRIAEGETMQREALQTSRISLGDESFVTIIAMLNLARTLHRTGNLREAEPLYREGLSLCERLVGDEEAKAVSFMGGLGDLLRRIGELDEAESLLRRSLDLRQKAGGPGDPSTLESMVSLASLLYARGDFDGAERYGREALEGARQVFGPDHPNTLVVMDNLAGVLRQKGQFAESSALIGEAVAGTRRALGESNWRVGLLLTTQARTLADLDDFEGAEACALEAHEILVNTFGSDHVRVQAVIRQLAELYAGWHEFEPSAGHDHQSNLWQDKLPPEVADEALSVEHLEDK